MFPFSHYHSNCHEALGIFEGSATLQFGGDTDTSIQENVEAGDVLLIPAGGMSGHFLCRQAATQVNYWQRCLRAVSDTQLGKMHINCLIACAYDKYTALFCAVAKPTAVGSQLLKSFSWPLITALHMLSTVWDFHCCYNEQSGVSACPAFIWSLSGFVQLRTNR